MLYQGSVQRTIVLLLVCALLLTSITFYATSDYLMDDALITLRYSYNFGQLGSPIWNEADIDNPSMGYTTPLWMILNAIPALFTSDRDALLTSARVIASVGLFVIIIIFSYDIAHRQIQLWAKLVLIVGIFGQAGFAFHVNSAMETILFSSLLLLTVHCL